MSHEPISDVESMDFASASEGERDILCVGNTELGRHSRIIIIGARCHSKSELLRHYQRAMRAVADSCIQDGGIAVTFSARRDTPPPVPHEIPTRVEAVSGAQPVRFTDEDHRPWVNKRRLNRKKRK